MSWTLSGHTQVPESVMAQHGNNLFFLAQGLALKPSFQWLMALNFKHVTEDFNSESFCASRNKPLYFLFFFLYSSFFTVVFFFFLCHIILVTICFNFPNCSLFLLMFIFCLFVCLRSLSLFASQLICSLLFNLK